MVVWLSTFLRTILKEKERERERERERQRERERERYIYIYAYIEWGATQERTCDPSNKPPLF